MVRIKICGLLSADDAAAAVDAGADLIGLNFCPDSPRRLTLAAAEEISARVEGRGVERVAVFRDARWEEIERVVRRIGLERVQFHGNESEEEIELVDLPVIKAVRGADRAAAQRYPGALLLLDHPQKSGGGGVRWDYGEAAGLVAEGYDIILAGGLTPENVQAALAELGELPPWGVDVASGVEMGGGNLQKSAAKMQAFVAAVKAAAGGGA